MAQVVGPALELPHSIPATTERATMTARMYARGLLAGAISILILGGGAAVAHADPDPTPPPMPPTLNQLETVDAPSIFTNPADRGRPLEKNWDGSGMYCQNIFVRCG